MVYLYLNIHSIRILERYKDSIVRFGERIDRKLPVPSEERLFVKIVKSMENYIYIHARLTRERASFEPYPLLVRKVTKIICCTNIPKDTIHLFIRFDRKLPIFRFII